MSKAQVFPELLTLPHQHHPPHSHSHSTSGSRGGCWEDPGKDKHEHGVNPSTGHPCPVFGAEALKLFSHKPSLLQPKVNILEKTLVNFL